MFGSDILNVFIGLAFIFFLFSLISSWIQEAIATLMRKRAKHLFNVISSMLVPRTADGKEDDKAKKLLKEFYNHTLIKGLVKPGKEAAEPEKSLTYIPAGEFSMALIDILYRSGKEADKNSAGAAVEDKGTFNLELIKSGISAMDDTDVKKALQLLVTAAETDEKNVNNIINALEKKFEAWFNSVMDRASEWYKRNIQVIALIVGIVLAGIFNVDSIALVKSLWQETALREAVTNAAAAYVEKEASTQIDENTYTEITEQINALGIPVGWDINKIEAAEKLPVCEFCWWLVFKILGILITGFAISQGSSFWYDILKRVVNMRITGPMLGEQEREKNKISAQVTD